MALRIRNMMLSTTTKVVVCSGACGADILALEAAAQLGLSRRLVLPFADRNSVPPRSPTAVKTGAVASTPFCNNCPANTSWN